MDVAVVLLKIAGVAAVGAFMWKFSKPNVDGFKRWLANRRYLRELRRRDAEHANHSDT